MNGTQLLEADTPEEAHRAFQGLADHLERQVCPAVKTLEDGLVDATAVIRLAEKYGQRLRTTNALERLLQEVRRRERVIIPE